MEPTDEVRAIGPCDDRDDLPLHRLAHRHDDSPMPPSFRSAVQPIAFDGLHRPCHRVAEYTPVGARVECQSVCFRRIVFVTPTVYIVRSGSRL